MISDRPPGGRHEHHDYRLGSVSLKWENAVLTPPSMVHGVRAPEGPPETRAQTRAARRQNAWSGGIFGVVLMTLEGVPTVKLLLIVGAALTLALGRGRR